MTGRSPRFLRGVLVVLALAALASCGLKGDPQPPKPQAQEQPAGAER